MGSVRPGRHFWGGEIEVIPKNLEREKAFWGGEILGRGYKRAVDERKIDRLQKKVVKKILGYETKISRGGRHPSYATEYTLYILHYTLVYVCDVYNLQRTLYYARV